VEAGVGESEGGVGFSVVEYDTPEMMAGRFGGAYRITAIPSLLAFNSVSREPYLDTKLVDARLMANRQYVESWIQSEAQRSANAGRRSLQSLLNF
jgi:hypothetical protein